MHMKTGGGLCPLEVGRTLSPRGVVVARPLASDALGRRIEPSLLPPKPRRFRFPGRQPLDRCMIRTGILFILKTGIAGEDLPAECGWGCGITCKRYLRRWQRQGVWQKLHEVLRAELNEADSIDWSRALIDSARVRALGGGHDTGPKRVQPVWLQLSRDRKSLKWCGRAPARGIGPHPVARSMGHYSPSGAEMGRSGDLS